MTPQASPEVRIVGLTHAYDAEPVLRDVDLMVAPGECLALLGPSGCGKTTLLRSIAGLERPAGGSISLGDQCVSGPDSWVPPERRGVGMVFQEWALFPHLDVAANVGYGLHGTDREPTAAVADALALVDLAGVGDRRPATLSGGQQQRVALARALAPRPRVLLLDEPFSNLDAALRAEVRTDVHRLLVQLGITSIFVTHDQEEAFVVGDRVAVMHEGRIHQVGTPQEIYHRPSTRWVAEFVGSASVLPGQANAGRASTILGSVPVAEELSGAVDVLVRPEHLAITESDRATVQGEVEMVEFYGHDAMVFVRVGDEPMQIRTGPMVGVTRGDHIGVTFVADQAPAFPASAR